MAIKTLEELPEILKLKQVARYLRVSVLTIKRMEKRGDLKVLRINSRGDRRIRKEDLVAFINSKL